MMPADETYYGSLGLAKDPFPGNADDIYFLTAELNHRLEKIRHLLEFSQRIPVITAPEGSGKTSLAGQILRHSPANWLLFSPVAQRTNPKLLLQLFIPNRTGADVLRRENYVESVKEYLRVCSREHNLPVVVIDDAQELPADTLELILQLVKLQQDNTSLHFVLLGEELLQSQLQSTPEWDSSNSIHHYISLPLFSREQSLDYIDYRISACGGVSEPLFSSRTLSDLHQVAGGRPGFLSQLARQSLQDPAMFIPAPEPASGTRALVYANLPLLTGFAILLVTLAVLVASPGLFTGEIHDNNISTDADEVLTAAPQPDQRNTGDGRDTRPISDRAVDIPGLKIEPGLTGAITANAALAGEPVAGLSVDNGGELPADHAEILPVELSGVRGVNWLRRQSPDQYVLQLIGARDMQTIRAFLDAQPTIAGDTTFIAGMNTGEPWFVLVYGLFDDRQQALAGIEKLPELARKQNPWARSIARVLETM